MTTIQVWSLLEAAPPIGNVLPGLQRRIVAQWSVSICGDCSKYLCIIVLCYLHLFAVCACALWIQRFRNMLKSCSSDISNFLSQWHSDSPESLRELLVFSRLCHQESGALTEILHIRKDCLWTVAFDIFWPHSVGSVLCDNASGCNCTVCSNKVALKSVSLHRNFVFRIQTSVVMACCVAFTDALVLPSMWL